MNLSTHFSFEELTLSDTAVRAGIDNTPPGQLMPNLVRLAAGLELVRAALGNKPIHVSSGFRSARLNQMLGGSKHSMHTRGLAADILCPQFGTPLEVCEQIARSGLAFDQVIHEFGRWCHVGFAEEGQERRNELLTIRSAASGACGPYEHVRNRLLVTEGEANVRSEKRSHDREPVATRPGSFVRPGRPNRK